MIPVDFGYENATVPWNDAKMVFLFDGQSTAENVGRQYGPSAVLDATRYIELFEMQVGHSPLDLGAAALLSIPNESAEQMVQSAADAIQQNKVPIMVSPDRQFLAALPDVPLVALFGKLGLNEGDEQTLFRNHRSIIGGIRAASRGAFASMPEESTIITARALREHHDVLVAALDPMPPQVHLCVDLDCLNPAAAFNPRSIEPGGLGWYDLIRVMEQIFNHANVGSLELTGTIAVGPRTPAAALCAQLLLRMAGLVALSREGV